MPVLSRRFPRCSSRPGSPWNRANRTLIRSVRSSNQRRFSFRGYSPAAGRNPSPGERTAVQPVSTTAPARRGRTSRPAPDDVRSARDRRRRGRARGPLRYAVSPPTRFAPARSLPVAPARMSVEVCDRAGRVVRTLKGAGRVTSDGRDTKGRKGRGRGLPCPACRRLPPGRGAGAGPLTAEFHIAGSARRPRSLCLRGEATVGPRRPSLRGRPRLRHSERSRGIPCRSTGSHVMRRTKFQGQGTNQARRRTKDKV